MKQELLTILLVGAFLAPTSAQARVSNDNPPGNEEFPDQHRCPSLIQHVYISYDSESEVATVGFRSAMSEASILIYQDGIEVDNIIIDTNEGTEIPVSLSTYGKGHFILQVSCKTTLLASYSITM